MEEAKVGRRASSFVTHREVGSYRRFDLKIDPSSSIYLRFSATQRDMLFVCFSTRFKPRILAFCSYWIRLFFQ